MKKILIMLIILVSLSVIYPQDPVKVREEMKVVNVEVPVRVFQKGKAVDHLTKEDFILYEDKVPQTINGFYQERKKINTSITVENPAIEQHQVRGRYFVLVFRITAFNDDIKKGLDHIFEKILTSRDKLLIFANQKTLLLDNLKDKIKARKLIDATLKQQSLASRHLLTGYLNKIKNLLSRAKTNLGIDESTNGLISPQSADKLLEFLRDYLVVWKEYKYRYLVPDMDKYYNFAHFLEKIAMQKWVISFYQVEIFPKLHIAGNFRRTIDRSINSWLMGRSEDIAFSRKVSAQLHVLDRELSAAENFPANEISKLFYKVGATFHSILMTVRRETNVRDLEFKGISTDIENSLRKITEKTGGALLATNNLQHAMDRVMEKEDIVYMLTYSPDKADQIGKIQVQLKGNHQNCEIIYDKNIREDYIREYLSKKMKEAPTIQLSKVTFKNKKLSFVISDFLMRKKKESSKGVISIRIQIKDNENRELYNQQKTIEADKDEVELSLGFARLNPGFYNIIIDVKDLFTGKEAAHLLQPEIL